MGRNLDEFVLQNYKRAIFLHNIQAYYQPVIRTSSRKLCSFEALARWIDPGLGMIYPDEFIPVMERNNIIHELDLGILRQVCARLRSSIVNGQTPIPVSVNLSRMDFMACDIFTEADKIVSDYQIPHDFVYFEITESVMAEQKELLMGIVDRFRAAGYQIWMDDFGSAYSSLNALKEFSFDELKLDMCFLRPFNLRSKRIATAVVEMAKSIDIHTLVEGVETEEQFRYMRNIGCEKVQGYYFGKPMPYDDALENMRMKGIEIEQPQDRQYYDDIGRIDFLSAVPFMTREEHEALVTARQLNSIPLALAELSPDCFRIMFYNTAFEDTAGSTGLFHGTFTQDMLNRPQKYNTVPPNLVNLMDSVREGGDGRMLFTVNDAYYEVKVRRVSAARDKFCVLVSITNLTKVTQSDNTDQLDEFSRSIYSLFERITLVNTKEDTIRPLYTSVRLDLLSARSGIESLVREYAEKYIYPDDRAQYIELFDPKSSAKRFKETGANSFSEVFRTNIRHGQYAWKEYTLLKLDGDNQFMLVRNVHSSAVNFSRHGVFGPTEEGEFSPAVLWNDLIRSDLLRLFWKDRERRFLGASQGFLDYYGFGSTDEIIGKNDEELGWHVHPDAYKSDEYQVIHEGKEFRNIPGLCRKDGENKEILASKMPLYDPNGEIKGLIGYFIDRETLNANDKRGEDTSRRDMLTGLFNARGISEEAAILRDEYYLRGTDFVRIHIQINDFRALNEQYGFDFGDKVLNKLGRSLKKSFGRTCAVGRCVGQNFVLLHQVKNRDEAHAMRDKIKSVTDSIKKVGGVPVTLYLSVGYTLFSDCLDLDEQSRLCDERMFADHDVRFSAESRIAHAEELFHLFDDLPLSYSVYHYTHSKSTGKDDAILFYVNHQYEEFSGQTAKTVLGQSVRELYPFIGEDWFDCMRRAALNGETAEGEFTDPASGRHLHYTARQILYKGYCAFTYQVVDHKTENYGTPD